MSLICINENGATIGVEANRFYVLYKDGAKTTVPIETIDGITIMGRSQMTSACIEECLKKGIIVTFFSKTGMYHRMLQSTEHVNTHRQRMQCQLYDTEFALELSRRQKKYEEMLEGLKFFASRDDSIKVYRINGSDHVKSYGVNINTIQDDVIVL